MPQRSVGNCDETAAYVHQLGALKVAPIGRWRDGHTAPVLCESCQARPSKKNFGYPREFKAWYEFVIAQLRDYVSRSGGADPLGEPYLDIEVPYDRMPGRFVRQVIGNVLAAQDSEWLLASHPQLGMLMASDPTNPRRPHEPLDIAPLQLFMALANRTTVIARAPTAIVTTQIGDSMSSGLWIPAGTSSIAMVVPYVVSPFAFVLTDRVIPGIDGFRIGAWTRKGVHERLPRRERKVRVPTLAGWTGPLVHVLRVETRLPA